MATNKPPVVTVKPRALRERVNRALRKEGRTICKSRSDNERKQLGEYYVTDQNTNAFVCRVDELEEWVRRELPGVLKSWERLGE